MAIPMSSMESRQDPAAVRESRAAIRRDHRIAEADAVRRLRALYPAAASSPAVQSLALWLAERARSAPQGSLSAESFLRQYGLSTREGVALMCLAEAILRIPDPETADALLREKLAEGNWETAQDDSWLASATEWALMLTGTLARWHDAADEALATVKRLAARLGEPVVRSAVRQGMRILAEQFVMAETIEDAVKRGAARRPYLFSYDMLGEAARTATDAARYYDAYANAIRAVPAGDGISIKLTALHPRFEEAKRARVFAELLPRLRSLAQIARDRAIGFTVDAEESERLELTLDVFEQLLPAAWPGFGIAVQAYQKRAPAVCDWLIETARASQARLAVRLVKGAYWDGEIKRAQQLGMPDYPVLTRKAATDVSYLACAAKLLAGADAIYPAFATHNARTVAAILELAGDAEFEFQRLLGMGEALYQALLSERKVACRIYAPVGRFTDLLPYLVRRLLENGANTSFVHQIADPEIPLEALVADPLAALPEPYTPNERIPLPRNLYPDRLNSIGLDLSRRDLLDRLREHISRDRLPEMPEPTSVEEMEGAIGRAASEFESWSRVPAMERAGALDRAAGLLEEKMFELVSLVVREGGRTYADAVAEVREAADFCRYYAAQARQRFAAPAVLPGPAGERNELVLHGRGVFACISPWNFPLAIFTGQVAAALAAGNTVIAKPAEQTPRTGLRAIEILREAGIPGAAVTGVIGAGETGARLIANPRIAGVAFTGSVETAKSIDRALAQRPGPIIPFIAETGGVNAMIVDASALPEQVVDDVVISAFQSAGQRCSAQRILFVDSASAPRVLELLAGALNELKVGDPAEPDTDIGPVIDAEAKEMLLRHIEKLRGTARLIGEAPLPGLPGHYVAPVAFELALDALPRTEVFGPVLHVHVYRREELDAVLGWLRDTGFGLTLGIHSRVQSSIDHVVDAARIGNIYVNRSMIGAVVGVQPFGGEGLSGTGPKAGGPHYLPRFATERTVTVNTAAVGGITELLAGGNS
jgi:RHH-type transcriptional regulator, proline utilization regulon repressor / proline dehydrogenase / delta 1-pyrroline-5-carboxylate dehydrogenase